LSPTTVAPIFPVTSPANAVVVVNTALPPCVNVVNAPVPAVTEFAVTSPSASTPKTPTPLLIIPIRDSLVVLFVANVNPTTSVPSPTPTAQ